MAKKLTRRRNSCSRIKFSPEALCLAREQNITPEEAVAELRRVHILLEHCRDRIIWVRCGE